MSRQQKAAMLAEDRAQCLKWPAERVCGWENCPWPAYCLDCHCVAHVAMWDGRARLISFITNVPLEQVMLIATKMER